MIQLRPSILFILHLPPPVHGAAMVGQYIRDSKTLNEVFNCRYVNLATAVDLKDIGKFGFKKIGRFFRLLKTIINEIRCHNPKLVYLTPNSCGGPFYKDFIVVSFLKMMGKKVVLHFHNKGVASRQHKVFDNFLYRRFFNGVKVMLLSDGLYDDIKKYVKREDILVCPNGIPETSPIAFHGEPQPPIKILYFSNLIISKGVLDLLSACEIIQSKGYDFVCNYVGGETKEMNALAFEEEVEKRHLKGKVSYLGKQFGKEKEKTFTESDVFVFPTFYPNECFPLVVLEAMQHGLPCISTGEGAIASIVDDGRTGFIVEKRNPRQLADKIEVLINNDELRKSMGDAGRKKFEENYTLDIFEKRMVDIFQQLLSN